MSKRTKLVLQRLSEAESPALDRSGVVTIRFDGEPIEAYRGDTVASAAYASGRQVFSRSFKYHRPRGLLCCSGACPNCLVTIDGTPNVRACTTPVTDEMHIESQNAFPSLEFDVFSVVDKLDRLLPVGFYYKTMMYPRSAWPIFELVLRNIAGLGRVDFDKQKHTHYARRHLYADVAVLGGGPAGLRAAIAAAEAGLNVTLVEDNPVLGGHLRGDTHVYEDAGEFSGLTGHQIALELSRRLANIPGPGTVEILAGAVVFGLYEGNLVAVAQGDTLLEIRASELVIATGVSEHPLVFQNNDLPGVMLGAACRRLMRLWAVKPAQRAVVVSAHDEGLRTACDLLDAGVTVVAVAEHRTEISDSPEKRKLTDRGVPILTGWSITEATGKGQVEGAVLAPLDHAGAPIDGGERHETCSLIAVSTGLETNSSLLWQAGCTMSHDEKLGLFTPKVLSPGVSAAGDVTGVRDLRATLLGGEIAGREAALTLGKGSSESNTELAAKKSQLEALAQQFRARTTTRSIVAIRYAGRKKFICPCEDVTLKDVQQAVEEGFDHIETLKRYTTVTMGPCQGKMCAMNSVAACAHATGRSIAETGTTTSRPLVQPVALGTIAGPHFDPVRLTPMHHAHLKAGAEMMDAGQWKRPRVYTSIEAEVRAVRERVGLIDVSTLGKIDLKGRDAVKLLEYIYTNKWADLREGRVRYSVMVDEAGIILDDGTIARLPARRFQTPTDQAQSHEQRFFITTTSSGVSAVEEWFTWWLEGTGWCAHATNVTAGLAAVNLAGPRARDVLAKLTDLDISAEILPYLRAVEGTVAGIPAIILRIGFVGELGYEMHVPAEYGEHLWNVLMDAGQEFGILPFGVEAQRTLRLEKGHIIVTQDTDALSTPLEADMSWIVKLDKPDFIGKTSLALLKEEGPGQKLVGFTMLDPTHLPAEGAPVVREDGYPMGRVTSTRYSPTLSSVIGLAWVPVSHGAENSLLQILIEGENRFASQFDVPTGESKGLAGRFQAPARVVAVPFYDPSGARMKC